MKVTDEERRRSVSGMLVDAAMPNAAVMPGTTDTGRPAACSASTSSPPRPKTNGSPAFRRTTVWPSRTRRIISASMSRCAQLARPLRFPTEISSASRRARERIAGGTRSSCRIASASCSNRAARRVRRSGSPGPAPTMWAMPVTDEVLRAESSSPSTTRRAPALSPASASLPAGPSTIRRQKARRSAGWEINALACLRKVCARSARAPIRSGSAASILPRSTVASVGEAPPVDTATTTSPRSTIAGRMKSQSAGRSATFTGTPAAFAMA